MIDKERPGVRALLDRRRNRWPWVGGFAALAWIPATAILIVMLIWIAVLVRIQTDGKEARDSVIALSAQLASSFSGHVAKTVHDADVIVRWVKFEYERSPGTFNVAAYDRQGLIAADTDLQVTIVGADGKVVQTTARNAQPVYLGDRPHFIIHKIHPDVGLYISQPVLGRLSGHWTLQFTRRLNNSDGSFAGIVVVSEDPNYMTNGFYTLDTLGGEGMLVAISDNGYLLSRRAGQRSGSSQGPPATVYREAADAQGSTFNDPVDGVRRFVAYRHLKQYPVAVLVGLSATNALTGLKSARRLYVLMATVISFLLLGAAGALTVMMRELMLLDVPSE